MKKIIFLLTFICIVGCGKTADNNQNFLNAYKEVLKIREANTDTINANAKVNAVLSKYGYDMNSFSKEYYTIAQERENFIAILDSLRQLVAKESDSLQNSK